MKTKTKILYFTILLLISSTSFCQHQSSFSMYFGTNMTMPVKSLRNVSSRNGFAELRREQKLDYNFGASFSYRIFTNSMIKTGVIFNAYGVDINYYNTTSFDDRDRTYENRYLTIPLLYKHEFFMDNFSLFLETGLSTNFYLNTRSVDSWNNFDRVERIPRVMVEGTTKFGFMFGLGIQKEISKSIQIFVNPNYRLFPHGDNETGVDGFKSFGINFGFRQAILRNEIPD